MAKDSTRHGRREVAERLRWYGNDTLKDGSLLKTLKDVTGTDSWRHVLLALAELIDPATSTTTFTPEESPIPLPVRLWVCARCGEEVIMMNDEGEPVACPYCKAVVTDDD